MNKQLAIRNFEEYLDGRGWKAREFQREAIEKICDYFDSGMKMVVMNAPTGSGKTIINWAVGSACVDAFYVTGNLSLQEQVVNDEFPWVKNISGRRNYECSMMAKTKCDEGLCQMKKGFECQEMCEYKDARDEALDASLALTNIWYFILEGGRMFQNRELLVVDEAHGLPELLVNFGKSTLSSRTVGEEIWEEIERMRPVEDHIDDIYSLIVDKVWELEENEELDDKGLKFLKRLKNLKVRLANARAGGEVIVDKVWSIDKKFNWYVVQPIYSGWLAEDLIFRRADKILLSSATINPYYIANELNTRELLGKGKVAYFTLPSTFPAENRKIYSMSVANFKYANQDVLTEVKMTDVIAAIINRHKDDKGIIFAQGYRYVEMLKDMLINYPELELRLMFHDSSNRKKVIKEWMERFFDNSVLVGIKCEEGLDLKDDIARFSICFKAPFANPSSDARIKARIDRGDWNWYNMMAQNTLCQAAGRIVRSEKDYGSFYIIDEGACKLIKRKGSPEYLKESIIECDYKKFLEKYGVDKGIRRKKDNE